MAMRTAASPARRLPAGYVTFLFTDIEGSTRMLEYAGEDEYSTLQAVQRRLVRKAVSGHGGVEVRTEGDSFFVAFADTGAAVLAALDAQRALVSHAWPPGRELRVRMGLHSGQARPVDGDYVSMAVNQAARISAAAHGGQVVMSAEVAAAVPETAQARTLGRHRLKDLGAAVELFQLCHPDLPVAFPPLQSLEQVLHNLPVLPTAFVGREAELAEVRGLLDAHRLVSLLGPGGTGKTRLAYQAAGELAGVFPDGVWVAELSALSSSVEVAPLLMAALGLRHEAGRSATETLTGHLRRRTALVVLDNCEHVVDAVAELVGSLLRGCPGITVLATTREVLRAAGETVYTVPGMSLPESAESDSVRLFLTRASEARPGFGVDAGGLLTVAAICARVDGLPLAIELAAARTRTLSPAQILERLGRTLDLLSRGSRGVEGRQASLRGAIDWSHQLLGQPEQVLFRRLAVFAGGFSLEAAETVCAGDGLTADRVLDSLEGLVDKSLVVPPEELEGGPRYRLLETIHEYARERLDASGEAATVAGRHVSWCLELALVGDALVRGSLDEARWFAAVDCEYANLAAALDYLNRTGDQRELEMVVALTGPWGHGGNGATASDLVARALDASPAASQARCRALFGLAGLELARGRPGEATSLAAEALELARARGDRQLEVGARTALGDALAAANTDGALSQYREALAIARALGDTPSESHLLADIGGILRDRGDLAEARENIAHAISLFEETGHRRGLGEALGGMGVVAMFAGDHDAARPLFDQAIAIADEFRDARRRAAWLMQTAVLMRDEGDYDQALLRLDQALESARAIGSRRSQHAVLGAIGGVLLSQERPVEAIAYLEEALTLATELGDVMHQGTRLIEIAYALRAEGDLSGARTRLERAVSMLDGSGHRQSQSYALAGLGEVAAATGNHGEARDFYAAALAIAGEVGDRQGLLAWNVNLGAAWLADGDLERARDAIGRALDVAADGVAGPQALGLLEFAIKVVAASGDQDAISRVEAARATLTVEQALRVAADVLRPGS